MSHYLFDDWSFRVYRKFLTFKPKSDIEKVAWTDDCFYSVTVDVLQTGNVLTETWLARYSKINIRINKGVCRQLSCLNTALFLQFCFFNLFCKIRQDNLCLVKVRKFQKQFILFSFPPTCKRKSFFNPALASRAESSIFYLEEIWTM